MEFNSFKEIYEAYKGVKDIYDAYKDKDKSSGTIKRPRDIRRSVSTARTSSGSVKPARVVTLSAGYGDPEYIANTMIGHTIRKYRLT